MPSNCSTPSAGPPADIKPESIHEDIPQNWPPSTLPSNAASMMTGMERHPSQMSSVDASIFLPPSAPFAHRPRISVSSVSSGSSGHASIWSTNSAQSSFSWHSATSGRSMAPLPMPPNTGGMPMMNGAHLPSAASNTNKQNIYWCTSCETSFKRKYDWKRHEDEFHERWRKYPCPEPGCNRSFWGSNSFNQHHKQCHGCKTCPHAEKVVKFLRKRKYWACGFCSALHPARERHVEHVARHFESGMGKGDWMHSRVIYGLMHQPLIHQAWENLVTSKQSEYSGRRPQFSWHPSKTGRAQGFLEKENPGQLQDLLEFFSGDDSEANWIVSVAYSLADIVVTPVTTPSPQYANTQGAMGPPPNQHPTFATLPSQAHQQQPMLPPPVSPNNPGAYASSFRGPMFVPSQSFVGQSRPSPDSSSHSPMAASQSPLGPQSQSPLDKQEMQPQQQSRPSGPQHTDSMMDFEYSPAPASFEDWQNMAPPIVESVTAHQHGPGGGQGDWGMLQYFSDPRVTTS